MNSKKLEAKYQKKLATKFWKLLEVIPKKNLDSAIDDDAASLCAQKLFNCFRSVGSTGDKYHTF